MKGRFFPFLFLIFISNLFATEQIRDSLVYNGKGYLIENQFRFEEMNNFRRNQFEKYQNTKFYRKDFRDCRKRREESIKHFTNTNQSEMVETEKQFDCVNFIKVFLFENPLYTEVL